MKKDAKSSFRFLSTVLAALAFVPVLPAQTLLYHNQQAEKRSGWWCTRMSPTSVVGLGDINGDGHGDYASAGVGSCSGYETGLVVAYSGRTGTELWRLAGFTKGSEFGAAMARVHDSDNDGVRDLLVGIPKGDPPGFTDGGQVVVVSAKAGKLIALIQGTGAGDLLGSSVAAAGDTNKDGVPDYIIGAPGYPKGSGWGSATVVSGKDSRTVLAKYFYGAAAQEYFGTSVAGVGDLDNDGHADVAVGAPGTGTMAGYVKYFSSRTKTVIQPVVTGGPGNGLGYRMCMVGDTNRDGKQDIAIANRDRNSGTDVYTAGTNQILRQFPLGGFAALGYGLARCGDVDNDGYDDVFLGAPYYVKSKHYGVARIKSGATGATLYEIYMGPGWTEIGRAIAVEDLNNDGGVDVIVAGHTWVQATTNNLYPGGTVAYSLRKLPLWADAHTISVANGGSANHHIEAGTAHAGKWHFVIGSITGITPGFPLFGRHVPLNFDIYTFFTAGHQNSPILSNSFNQLDASGNGKATFIIPPNLGPEFVGLLLDHAVLVWSKDFVKLDFVTNPRPVTLLQ